MKLARLASTPPRRESASLSVLSGASSVNSAEMRGVIVRLTRKPTVPPFPIAPPGAVRTGSSGVIRPVTGKPVNVALMALSSAAPSPKYHDEAARLVPSELVLNVAPAGGRLLMPPDGLLPANPPP